MTLPKSGALSFSAIQAEVGSSVKGLRAMSAAAGKSTPDATSEFYGHQQIASTKIYVFSDGGPFNSQQDACDAQYAGDISDVYNLFYAQSQAGIVAGTPFFEDTERVTSAGQYEGFWILGDDAGESDNANEPYAWLQIDSNGKAVEGLGGECEIPIVEDEFLEGGLGEMGE